MIRKYKEDMERAIKAYEYYKNKSENNFVKIINGAKFGMDDDYDASFYFPHEFVEIVDRDNFIIKTKYKVRDEYNYDIRCAGEYVVID